MKVGLSLTDVIQFFSQSHTCTYSLFFINVISIEGPDECAESTKETCHD